MPPAPTSRGSTCATSRSRRTTATSRRREGLPANALKLKELFKAADGLLIASPEYNSAISGTLKNVLDWVSRTAPGEKPLECFKGKVAALCSASTGALGGIRGLASSA